MFDATQIASGLMTGFGFIKKIVSDQRSRKDKIKKKEDIAYTETVLVPKSSGKLTKVQRTHTLANAFHYEDDVLYTAKSYSKKRFEKYIAVLHFSWTPSLQRLTSLFHKIITTANSTWGVGKDGTVHRYLPEVTNPSWTQGLKWKDKGGFIDYRGKWIKQVNNVACGFEIANINKEPYTEKQYEAVAVRLLWMLDYFKHYRLWFTTGHEYIVPYRKSDPGKEWDWEKLFVDYCGIKKKFYKEYLSYLQELSYSTVNNKVRSTRKLGMVKEATTKIQENLIGLPKDICF